MVSFLKGYHKMYLSSIFFNCTAVHVLRLSSVRFSHDQRVLELRSSFPLSSTKSNARKRAFLIHFYQQQTVNNLHQWVRAKEYADVHFYASLCTSPALIENDFFFFLLLIVRNCANVVTVQNLRKRKHACMTDHFWTKRFLWRLLRQS